jgi:MFS family permease
MRNGFFGWRVVGAAFIVGVFAWGINFYGPPIFLEILHTSRGWPVPLVSAAITTHFLLGAVVVANLAALHQRFGIAAITRAGALLTALGVLGWAFAQEPWQLFLATPISGAGWAMTSGAALNAMVAPWFVRRRPVALSMAFNGASMGGVIFSPLWVMLIATFGFPTAAILVAVSVVVVLWLLAGRYIGRSPAEMGLVSDGDIADRPPLSAKRAPAPADAAPLARPWQDRRTMTLATAAALALFAQIGLVTHLFSLLVPILGTAAAGATMGAATGCAILGRTLLGMVLGPTADRRLVAAANVTVQAMGSIVLLSAGSSLPMVLLGCALFGLGLGNVTSLPPLIAQTEFRPADVARVVALVTAISQAGYAFAPAAFGLLRSLSGTMGFTSSPDSAPLLFVAAAIIQLAAAGAALLGRRPAPQGKAALIA